jgi:hypothetical protein
LSQASEYGLGDFLDDDDASERVFLKRPQVRPEHRDARFPVKRFPRDLWHQHVGRASRRNKHGFPIDRPRGKRIYFRKRHYMKELGGRDVCYELLLIQESVRPETVYRRYRRWRILDKSYWYQQFQGLLRYDFGWRRVVACLQNHEREYGGCVLQQFKWLQFEQYSEQNVRNERKDEYCGFECHKFQNEFRLEIGPIRPIRFRLVSQDERQNMAYGSPNEFRMKLCGIVPMYSVFDTEQCGNECRGNRCIVILRRYSIFADRL